MKRKLYKITNIKGKDFWTDSIKYEVGKIVEAPDWEKTAFCGNGLHLVDDINKIEDITGFKFPCRVFEVKIIGKDYIEFGNKIKCRKLKVIKELTIEEINELLKNIEIIDRSSVKVFYGSAAGFYKRLSAILYNNSSAELYDSSSAILWDNSSAELCGNSSAILYNKSSAKLYSNSSAKLCDNSVAYIYSENATIIPQSTTCVAIKPYKKVFTFKESQLGKKYRVEGRRLVEVK